MSSKRDRAAGRPSIRWWPAVLILALETAVLAYIWLRDAPSLQHRVVPSFPTLFVGAVALVVWLVLFSRLSRPMRRKILLGVALTVAVGFALLEIKGVDGNLVPIVGWRWSGERQFDDTVVPTPELLTPGLYDYPQFYGPRRNATLPGPRLAKDWQARPPREIWRREVGEGWSAFAVAGDAAVTQEQRGEDEVVVRYEVATGRQVWVHSDRAPFNTTIAGSGPRATPTLVGGLVYTLGATGILNCLDLEDGRKVWSRNVLEDDGAEQPPWGMASSPLVAGELVIVQTGRNGSSLAAYDRRSGEPAWRAPIERGTYTSPVLLDLAGRQQVLVVNQTNVTGHDPVSGEVLWREDWPNPGGERVTPPLLLGDDRILVSAGYGTGSRLLRVRSEGGNFRVEELWESRRLKSKFAPMVTREGVVYGLDDGVLVALDPATGERLWKQGRYGHGQLLLIGELLLIQAENGDVVLVEANPREHRELGRFTAFDSKTWNPPALSGRRLLVRNNRQAACFELPVEG